MKSNIETSEVIVLKVKNASDNTETIHLFKDREKNHKHVLIYTLCGEDNEFTYDELCEYIRDYGLIITHVIVNSNNLRDMVPFELKYENMVSNPFRGLLNYDVYQQQSTMIQRNMRLVEENGRITKEGVEFKGEFDISFKMKSDTQLVFCFYKSDPKLMVKQEVTIIKSSE